MYEPKLLINYGAIAVAALAYFFIGWLWYSMFLFGKAWAKELKLPADFKPTPAAMVKSMLLMLAGCFLTSYVLTHAIQVWRPSVWGVTGVEDGPSYLYGIMAAGFTWVGYYLPLHLNGVAFEQKSWKLFGINAGYHFVALQAVGQILAHWR